MGWIHKRHMQSGGSLNSNSKNNGSDGGPLRKILGRTMQYAVWVAEKGRAVDWRAWNEVFVTTSPTDARKRLADERAVRDWSEVRLIESGPMEVLECGHLQSPKSDLMGETAPVRRRCRKCKKVLPIDVDPSDYV